MTNKFYIDWTAANSASQKKIPYKGKKYKGMWRAARKRANKTA